jgi:hypothetical protein
MEGITELERELSYYESELGAVLVVETSGSAYELDPRERSRQDVDLLKIDIQRMRARGDVRIRRIRRQFLPLCARDGLLPEIDDPFCPDGHAPDRCGCGRQGDHGSEQGNQEEKAVLFEIGERKQGNHEGRDDITQG